MLPHTLGVIAAFQKDLFWKKHQREAAALEESS